MTNKQEAKAITEFLTSKLKESAKKFKEESEKEEGYTEQKQNVLARVVIIRDLLKELKDGE